jgi:hypothetical protein
LKNIKILKPQKNELPNIALCILLDVIGMATYIFPAVGEYADIVWAPISAYIFFKLFGGRVGKIGAVLNFLEEILPFTDIIPTFTIAWAIRYFGVKNQESNKMPVSRQRFF